MSVPENVPESVPGSADLPVGKNEKEGHVSSGGKKEADEDVGAPKGWYSRGYLPHCDEAHLIQSITFRLADSLPQVKLAELKEELGRLPENQREVARRKRMEGWLDAGMGCCALAHPAVARYVQYALLHFHGVRYHVHAWCIMPNHVHVLIEPLMDLAKIVQGWKSYTARWVLARNGDFALKIPASDQLWMREYWDRYIRDAAHYENAVEYIHQNPVKAGLCPSAEVWPWSSATPGIAPPGIADVPVVRGNEEADEDVGAPG